MKKTLITISCLHFSLKFTVSLSPSFLSNLIMYLPLPPFRSSTLCNGSSFLILPHNSHSFTSSPCSPSAALGNGVTRRLLPMARVTRGVRFDVPVSLNDDVEEEYQVVFEHCVTRTLPPALTLEEGLQKFKDALEMLKMSPPSCSTGFLRFQVSLPIYFTHQCQCSVVLYSASFCRNLCCANVESIIMFCIGENWFWLKML